MDEKEIQQMIIRLRQYQAQAELINGQIGLIQASINDHEKALATLKDLKSLKPGDELLVSIGAGSSIYTTLSKVDRVIIGLGAGVSAEKSPEEAIEILTKRSDELNEMRGKMTNTLIGIEQEIQKIQSELQAAAAKQQR
ncbi:MAG: prefoldin subunit alpha [Candidatus Syntropharchaeia archaeon]